MLSKSRFVTGCQCHKLLWWTVHEPDAVELQPDKVLQDLFDQGRQVGEIVMRYLRDLDEVAFVRFASVYRQFNDVYDFFEELRPLLEDETRHQPPR